MAQMWYVERDGQKEGPISSSQLKAMAISGHVTPASRLWKDGVRDSFEAGRIDGLFPSPANGAIATASSSLSRPNGDGEVLRPAMPRPPIPIRAAQAALVCPHCGGAIAVPAPVAGYEPQSGKVAVVTEQTAKRWKLMMLASAVAAIVGIAMAAIGASQPGHEGQASLGCVLLVLGLGGFVVARMLAWWFHG